MPSIELVQCMTRLAIATVTVFLLTGCNDGPMDGEPAAQTETAPPTPSSAEAAQEPGEPTFMLPDQRVRFESVVPDVLEGLRAGAAPGSDQ